MLVFLSSQNLSSCFCLLSPLMYLQVFNLCCFKPYIPVFCTFLSEFIPIITEVIILYFFSTFLSASNPWFVFLLLFCFHIGFSIAKDGFKLILLSMYLNFRHSCFYLQNIGIIDKFQPT